MICLVFATNLFSPHLWVHLSPRSILLKLLASFAYAAVLPLRILRKKSLTVQLEPAPGAIAGAGICSGDCFSTWAGVRT